MCFYISAKVDKKPGDKEVRPVTRIQVGIHLKKSFSINNSSVIMTHFDLALAPQSAAVFLLLHSFPSLCLKPARVISISELSSTLRIRILPPLIKRREKDETEAFDCTPHVVRPQRSTVPKAPRSFL